MRLGWTPQATRVPLPLAAVLSGQRLHEGGGTVNLSSVEWLDRWREFKQYPQGGSKSN
jgi:hypothetical protein